jgi:NAD(P)-dependent dehydrogenase (short-subunit alcohol dehydrogenase family)
MRVALIVHGLPPRERTGVETHVAELAEALARAGAEVLVLALRKQVDLPHLAERREPRAGYAVDWLVVNEPPRDVLAQVSPPGVAEAVGD